MESNTMTAWDTHTGLVQKKRSLKGRGETCHRVRGGEGAYGNNKK